MLVCQSAVMIVLSLRKERLQVTNTRLLYLVQA